MNDGATKDVSFYRSIQHSVTNFGFKIIRRFPYLKKPINSFLYEKRRRMYMKYYHQNKLENKTVFFDSFLGKNFSDNPKAIYLEMKNDPQFKDYTFIWSFKDPSFFQNDPLLEGALLVRRNSSDYYKSLAKSKYWFSNFRMYEFLVRKPEQIYVQTWHGTPFKKIGLDVVYDNNARHSNAETHNKYKRDEELFTHIISPSRFCSEKLTSSFGIKNPENKLLEVGYPRNDFLKKFSSSDVAEVKLQLGVPQEKKIILYAPTWRDNNYSADTGFTFECPIDFTKLKDELGDEYVFIVRFHYLVASQLEGKFDASYVIDASNYPDINNLYIISDMLITDYSSVFFDYAILNRPMLFFMYDLEEYANNLRGFYFSPNDLPGLIIQTEDEIASSILRTFTIEDQSIEKRGAWIDEFSSLEDGYAARRVIEQIFK